MEKANSYENVLLPGGWPEQEHGKHALDEQLLIYAASGLSP
jgi:hypothetical protein